MCTALQPGCVWPVLEVIGVHFQVLSITELVFPVVFTEFTCMLGFKRHPPPTAPCIVKANTQLQHIVVGRGRDLKDICRSQT